MASDEKKSDKASVADGTSDAKKAAPSGCPHVASKGTSAEDEGQRGSPGTDAVLKNTAVDDIHARYGLSGAEHLNFMLTGSLCPAFRRCHVFQRMFAAGSKDTKDVSPHVCPAKECPAFKKYFTVDGKPNIEEMPEMLKDACAGDNLKCPALKCPMYRLYIQGTIAETGKGMVINEETVKQCPAYNPKCPAFTVKRFGELDFANVESCPAYHPRCPAFNERGLERIHGMSREGFCPYRCLGNGARTFTRAFETELRKGGQNACPAFPVSQRGDVTKCPMYHSKCPAFKDGGWERFRHSETSGDPRKCPVYHSQCPAFDGGRHGDVTKCPVYHSKCPAFKDGGWEKFWHSETSPDPRKCPVYHSKYPEFDGGRHGDVTKCPVYHPKCPAFQRNDNGDLTKCPMFHSKCPAFDGGRHGDVTKCPVYHSKCPAFKDGGWQKFWHSETSGDPRKCPVYHSQCPAFDGGRHGDVTKCPVYHPKCPAFQHSDSGDVTKCPMYHSKCPAFKDGGWEKFWHSETSGDARKCPVYHSKCPAFQRNDNGDVTKCPMYHSKYPAF